MVWNNKDSELGNVIESALLRTTEYIKMPSTSGVPRPSPIQSPRTVLLCFLCYGSSGVEGGTGIPFGWGVGRMGIEKIKACQMSLC